MKTARDKNHVQKNQMKILKLQSSVPKVKKKKNSPEGLNCRFQLAEEIMSKLEDSPEAVRQSEEERKK